MGKDYEKEGTVAQQSIGARAQSIVEAGFEPTLPVYMVNCALFSHMSVVSQVNRCIEMIEKRVTPVALIWRSEPKGIAIHRPCIKRLAHPFSVRVVSHSGC